MSKLAWHFTDGPRLRDGRPLPAIGETLRHEGEVIACESGLHASARLLDACNYAPGCLLHRVRLGGTIVDHGDKLVASERTILATVDATRTLHEFACDAATALLDAEEAAGRTVDPRSRRAIEVKRLWLEGKATDQELAAAWDAARDAAWVAAWDAQETELTRRIFALLAESGYTEADDAQA